MLSYCVFTFALILLFAFIGFNAFKFLVKLSVRQLYVIFLVTSAVVIVVLLLLLKAL